MCAVEESISWLSTKEASELLGVTLRTLYRFIDEGEIVAYKFGRVIRLQEDDVRRFIDASRIEPGTLDHLYPELRRSRRESAGAPGRTAGASAGASAGAAANAPVAE